MTRRQYDADVKARAVELVARKTQPARVMAKQCGVPPKGPVSGTGGGAAGPRRVPDRQRAALRSADQRRELERENRDLREEPPS